MPRNKQERSASEVDIPRLCDQIYRSRLVLKPFRENRREAVRQTVGAHWSENGSVDRVPVNLLALYVQTVSRALVARDPRITLSTQSAVDRPTVAAMEAWANLQIVRQRLGDELRRCVVDGLYCMGVAKVALATPADAALEGWGVQAGMPYLCGVDIDDFAFDPHCTDLRDASWVGHRYRVPLDAVKDSRYYTAARRKLNPSPDRFYNATGDERIGMVFSSSLKGNDEFEDMADLWEVYLPRHNMVLTLPASDGYTDAVSEPLRVQNWVGPPCGPYTYLGFGTVPGSPMPLAPVQNLLDLQYAENLMYNKLLDQTARQKTLLFYQGDSAEDADRVTKAGDGEGVMVTNPDRVREVPFGGPNQAAFQMALNVHDRFGFFAGNLPAMMGIPQSKTASQDEMAAQGANATLGDLAATATDFMSRAMHAMTWFWWNHPELVAESRYEVPGTGGIGVTRRVYPRGKTDESGMRPDLRRDSPFDGLDLRVDPYSVMHTTPQQKAAQSMQFFQQVLVPMMPLLQQQGIVPDVQELLKQQAKFLDAPWIADLINIQDPLPTTGGPEAPGMPAATSRTYNRVSSGGGRTPEGESEQAVSSFKAATSASGSNGRYQSS
jgi:hypothetical protein